MKYFFQARPFQAMSPQEGWGRPPQHYLLSVELFEERKQKTKRGRQDVGRTEGSHTELIYVEFWATFLTEIMKSRLQTYSRV